MTIVEAYREALACEGKIRQGNGNMYMPKSSGIYSIHYDGRIGEMCSLARAFLIEDDFEVVKTVPPVSKTVMREGLKFKVGCKEFHVMRTSSVALTVFSAGTYNRYCDINYSGLTIGDFIKNQFFAGSNHTVTIL